MARARSVRVTRNGNARTLTVPAEIAAAAEIEVGDEYVVEVVNGNLLYRRVDPERTDEWKSPRGRIVGEGCERHFEYDRGMVVPAGPDPSPRALDDWDF